MTWAPSAARTVQRAPPCVLRLEERLGWGHPAPAARASSGSTRRRPCRAAALSVAAVDALGAGAAGAQGGTGGAGPEAAAGMPICVGRGHSLPCRALATCPARLPPGQLAAAVSHPTGMAHTPPRDSRPTGPAGSALARREGRAAEAGRGVPIPPLWPPCPRGSSGAQVQARQ